MDCSSGDSQLLTYAEQLPAELIATLRGGTNEEFLSSLASAALNPKLTDIVFVCHEPLFPELCARYSSYDESAAVIPIFGRVLPFAPYLIPYAEKFLQRQQRLGLRCLTSDSNAAGVEPLSESQLCDVLLGYFRLLVFTKRSFRDLVQPADFLPFLSNPSECIRYLTIRIIVSWASASDNVLHRLLLTYLGDAEVRGIWEGKCIDYRFLSLWEEKRLRELSKKLQEAQELRRAPGSLSRTFQRSISLADISPLAAEVCGLLMPKISARQDQVNDPGDVRLSPVLTLSTSENLNSLVKSVLRSNAILVSGPPGSGKTLLINYLAQESGQLRSMITLHLNPQTDAKSLLGMYATGLEPGSFVWKAGVLTTAVREGRWVLIEDIDRIPNEVTSILMPLLERGELLIPGNNEPVLASQGFKIFATRRTHTNQHHETSLATPDILGIRLWTQVHLQAPDIEELGIIIREKYPRLDGLVLRLAAVYAAVESLSRRTRTELEYSSGRPLSVHDLLRWCSRVDALLLCSSQAAEFEDYVFLEALDCFTGHLSDGETNRDSTIAIIARELHVDPGRLRYLVTDRQIRLEILRKASGVVLRIGRTFLPGQRSLSTPLVNAFATEFKGYALTRHTLQILEKISVAVACKEPLLLVGETGIGKTSTIHYLAQTLGHKLVVVNLSQQTEGRDLLGGLKPVNVRSLVAPLHDEFTELFHTTFSHRKNQLFAERLGRYLAKGQWSRVFAMWLEASRMSDGLFGAPAPRESALPGQKHKPPNKRRRLDPSSTSCQDRWLRFAGQVRELQARVSSEDKALSFSFSESNVVKAVRNGDWLLLDEINLASTDTIECLSDLFGDYSGGPPFLMLTETCNAERVVAHENFRIFAAMNPPTDVGKKDLPLGIRSRFAEMFVGSPDRDIESLKSIIRCHLAGVGSFDSNVQSAIAATYLDIKALAEANKLADGSGRRPQYSLRSLTRALLYIRNVVPLCSARQGSYEGLHMSFCTMLDQASERLVSRVIDEHMYGRQPEARFEVSKPLRKPVGGDFVPLRIVTLKHESLGERPVKANIKAKVDPEHAVEICWVPKGPQIMAERPDYIITPSVRLNLRNLARAIFTRKFPILLQGPTSSGKTSMIEYLASKSGNKFVRINNHEHTDLQEYLGSYMSDRDGRLSFQEGILVQALRNGHWVVLDELNLAPSDVLEALNRLLDENRELLIPETQEIVRPHPNFVLFATQNPPGLYGGRKFLSRALRNRFLELHFDDIPIQELAMILQNRCSIPRSWCQRVVKVYETLSMLRQRTRIFEQKSFATLRDLFRWAFRRNDTLEQLAANGVMLLAERVRNDDERQTVKNVIEETLSDKGPRIKVDEALLYSEQSQAVQYAMNHVPDSGLIWTRSMRRLFTLVYRALQNKEPVLLVGETGSGKTTVCQVVAAAAAKSLFTVNANQNTEVADLIGAQRPVRNRTSITSELRRDLVAALELASCPKHYPGNNGGNDGEDVRNLIQSYEQLHDIELKRIPHDLSSRIRENKARFSRLFEWVDGSLVQAMKKGQYFLVDEISLAEDAVLERLNSVLEPERKLLLAEKGAEDSLVVAADGFQILATMNPGGDYGKRELSPALRNRFTEIWVPSPSDDEDVYNVVVGTLEPSLSGFARPIVAFAKWFRTHYHTSTLSTTSLRDALAWVSFVNGFHEVDPLSRLVHGAAVVYIDTIGATASALTAVAPTELHSERQLCLDTLSALLGTDLSTLYHGYIDLRISQTTFSVGPFQLQRSRQDLATSRFSVDAPTPRLNIMRVMRALRLPKPILLEGSPGVGKTSLVVALAGTIGKPLTRINLSEQTELMDLFGSDAPAEDGQLGDFAWRDGPFLTALKNGHWVLLDEMNLASQTVLEGLNACLDHRGEIYVPELDRNFYRHPEFRLFAAQNPHHQGGGRKGLPTSFVNRFTVVFADALTPDDLLVICRNVYPSVPVEMIQNLVKFVTSLDRHVVQQKAFGSTGGPWEFNLRDILRWIELLTSKTGLLPAGSAYDFADIIFIQRFRSLSDRADACKIFNSIFVQQSRDKTFYHNLSPTTFQVGLGLLARTGTLRTTSVSPAPFDHLRQLPVMESLMVCIQRNWPVILAGPSGCGKSVLIRQLAAMVGATLVEFPISRDIDAGDLVGSYEQADPGREEDAFLATCDCFLRRLLLEVCVDQSANSLQILELVASFLRSGVRGAGISKLHPLLSWIIENTTFSEARDLLNQCQSLMAAQATAGQAQFQWLNGKLVEAVERGYWIVLDNANLSSSSVLDRLNSLLEPDGHLLVSERPSAEGNARFVRPHPSFRLLMTIDPKHGELSRAMRNRAVELYLLSHDKSSNVESCEVSSPFLADSSVYRFRHLVRIGGESCHDEIREKVLEVGLDHTSFMDTRLLESFQVQLSSGLLGTGSHDMLLSTQSRIQLASFFEQRAVYPCTGDDLTLTNLQTALPIHPIVNERILPLQFKTSSSIYGQWLADAYEMLLDTARMKHAVAENHATMRALMPSTRIEVPMRRSHASMREPTLKVASFLVGSCDIIRAWLLANLNNTSMNQAIIDAVKDMCNFWWHFLTLLKSSDFDEASLHVYSSLAYVKCSRLQDRNVEPLDLSSNLQRLLRPLRPANRLSTGLSMERLWSRFRPKTVSTIERLHTLLHVEAIADRLDNIIWRIHVLPADLTRLRNSVAIAIRTILQSDAEVGNLVQDLDAAVSALETESSESCMPRRPHFGIIFESICRHVELQEPADSYHLEHGLLSLLAGRRTVSTVMSDRQEMAAKTSDLPPRECHFPPFGFPSVDFPIMALRALDSVDGVTLQRLDLLKTEILTLGSSLARASGVLCTNISVHQAVILSSLLTQILGSHKEYFDQASFSQVVNALKSITPSAIPSHNRPHLPLLKEHEALPSDHYFRKPHFSHLQPSLRHLAVACSGYFVDLGSLSAAWIHFALACIELYVPDRPIDPALPPRIQRDLYEREKKCLRTRMQVLATFESSFSGKKTNLRYKLVQQKLETMGSAPSTIRVARPLKPGLESLQADLQPVLQLAKELSKDIANNAANPSHCLAFQRNICGLKQRLSANHRAYDDITSPAVLFLEFLETGLDIAVQHTSRPPNSTDAPLLLELIPFLSGEAVHILDLSESTTSYVDKPSPEFHLNKLSLLALVQSIEPSHKLDRKQRMQICQIFEELYRYWKTNLTSDQKKAASDSSLYRYRDAQVNEDDIVEADYELIFPTFADERRADQASLKDSLLDPRRLAIKVAEAHEDLYSDIRSPSSRLHDLLIHAVSTMNSAFPELTKAAYPRAPPQLLAAIILQVRHQMEVITSDPSDDSRYNFYVHPNPVAAGKTQAPVEQIMSRARSIQTLWPEHATLQHIIVTCTELLGFSHTEPVAKFLTKAEKLYEATQEWERVANKECSMAGLCDNLCTLIISWRRLELVSWSRLLDDENDNCRREAKAWWFVAYESIVATSRSSIASKDIAGHLNKLTETLESFCSSTSAGQFSTRLSLITLIGYFLAMCTPEEPELKAVLNVLKTFKTHFSRYEAANTALIERERHKIEQQVKEVIKVASWKGGSIGGLRRSAKRSHRKLFTLIGKYRAVLARPVCFVASLGLPFYSVPQDQSSVSMTLETIPFKIASDAAKACQALLPRWNLRPARFQNIPHILAVMRRKAEGHAPNFSGAENIATFLSELSSSTEQLLNATPSSSTKDNNSFAKHLKSRKRRLFADAMKRLRQMGFNSNLSHGVLSRQGSLSRVLARMAPPSAEAEPLAVLSASSYLHDILDLMNPLRDTLREHSEDLTSWEVTRCTGYFESMLASALAQRRLLFRALHDLKALETAIECLQKFAIDFETGLAPCSSYIASGHRSIERRAAWLRVISEAGADIVETHSALGKLDEFEVVNGLRNYATKFWILQQRIDAQRNRPNGVLSTQQQKDYQECLDLAGSLRSQASQWVVGYPNVAFILEHIIIWAQHSEVHVTTQPDGHQIMDTDTWMNDTFAALDVILGSMQDLEQSSLSAANQTNNSSWLRTEESARGERIAALHAAEIACLLNKLSNSLKDLSAGAGLKCSAALFAAFLPIFLQYVAVYRHEVHQLEVLHRMHCKMALHLTRSYLHIAKHGFCQPPESSEDKGTTEKGQMEGGTGLGAGEGAEDISKEISGDEDLTELTEASGRKDGELKTDSDAVGVDDLDAELEDDLTNHEDAEGLSQSESEQDDISEQPAKAGDLPASAVDDKQWAGEEDDKLTDKQSKEIAKSPDNTGEQAGGVGQRREDKDQRDHQTLSSDDGVNSSAHEEEEPPKANDILGPHVTGEDVLDLPDEFDLNETEADQQDDVSDASIELLGQHDEQDEKVNDLPPEESQTTGETGLNDSDGEGQAAHTDTSSQKSAQADEESPKLGPIEDTALKLGTEQPSSGNAEQGMNGSAYDGDRQVQTDKQPDGSMDSHAEKMDTAAPSYAGSEGHAGEGGTHWKGAKGGHEPSLDSTFNLRETVKSAGDYHEKWHRQHKNIWDATEKDHDRQKHKDVDLATADFAHLQSADDQADTQALGAASEEQARALDESLALTTSNGVGGLNLSLNIDEETALHDHGGLEGPAIAQNHELSPQNVYETLLPVYERSRVQQAPLDNPGEVGTCPVLEVDGSPSALRSEPISPSSLRSIKESRRIWLEHEISTHSLSLTLTEQLRLILAPTLAARMRGDFRTGKRLNIKRIIPYIASQYKRDKIWMRRSVPSKRNYQIMLSLDDSKSMAESGSVRLAFETLALLVKSLSMLEVGELSVVGFGRDVHIAHDFSTPFTPDAGPSIVDRFEFMQTQTDVRRLLEHSALLFRSARQRLGDPSADLWQLHLIISDGICEDHGTILRLTRQAESERIMTVFIIVDGLRGQSITGLEVAEFVQSDHGTLEVTRKRYLENFPFKYFVIVRDIAQLPEILASALRQWFAEVVNIDP